MGACPSGRGGCCGGHAGSLSVDIAMCDTSDKSHGKDQVLVEGLCVCVSVVQGGECPLTHPLAWSPPGAVSLFVLVRRTERQLLAHGAVLCFFMLCSAWRDECGGHEWLPLVTEALVFVGGCKDPCLSHGVPRVAV